MRSLRKLPQTFATFPKFSLQRRHALRSTLMDNLKLNIAIHARGPAIAELDLGDKASVA